MLRVLLFSLIEKSQLQFFPCQFSAGDNHTVGSFEFIARHGDRPALLFQDVEEGMHAFIGHFLQLQPVRSMVLDRGLLDIGDRLFE